MQPCTHPTYPYPPNPSPPLPRGDPWAPRTLRRLLQSLALRHQPLRQLLRLPAPQLREAVLLALLARASRAKDGEAHVGSTKNPDELLGISCWGCPLLGFLVDLVGVPCGVCKRAGLVTKKGRGMSVFWNMKVNCQESCLPGLRIGPSRLQAPCTLTQTHHTSPPCKLHEIGCKLPRTCAAHFALPHVR